MEASHTLVLNTTALNVLPEQQRPLFTHEWLRFLLQRLPVIQRSEVRENQKQIVAQLVSLMQQGFSGGPTRQLLAQCLTTIFAIGDTFLLFDTINTCNDILKNKDDSPSVLPSRLTSICVLGHMYETLGRMTGRSYEETVQHLFRGLKNAESQARVETMTTLGKICIGLGSAASNLHRDIYKCLRSAMASDRAMTVRAASAMALLSMAESAAFLTSTELDNVATTCFKAMDGANYVTRKAIAKCLGTILAMTQQQTINSRKGIMVQPKKANVSASQQKNLPVEDAFAILMQGFLKGASGSGLIKGASPVPQEVRVGITHCYVIMVQTLGSNWLEKHLNALLTHVLDLVAHPKAASSHVDAVYSRRCVGYIIQILLGKMLGEKAQLAACKEIIHIIEKLMNSVDVQPENTKDSSNPETMYSQHQLVVALQELGTLFLRLGTAARSLLNDAHLRLTDVLLSTLLHPCQAPRLAAAFCLRCLCIAVPSHLTPCIDRCLDGLEKYKGSAESVIGYSGAIAALLGAVRLTPLGIPHTRGKFIFNVGEDLLRSASQNSRLARERTQAGWLLIGSIMTLKPAVVKGLLPRMMLLWRNAFPRSQKELESEKSRGDAFTWRRSLEARSGAMASIHAFLQNAMVVRHPTADLINEDVLRRLAVPIEACLNLCSNIGPVVKAYPVELKALSAMLRLRLFEALSLLPPSIIEGSYTQLLRLLVGEFTLADGQSNTSTSLLRSLCHADDSVILGTHFQDAEEQVIEEQLLANSASGSGALEHDLCSLFRPLTEDGYFSSPGPLPLGVSVVDQSVVVFGRIFPRAAHKHRLQMLQHFGEHLRQAQQGKANKMNGEAIQLNIFTAVLSSLKGLVDARANFIGQEEVMKAAVDLILGALTSPNPMLRCAAGEALGRMAQVAADADAKFVADMVQSSFECLKTARDVVSRTGHSLALGCLHRYVGGMGSAQHLHSSVSVLLALAHDQASPEVQVWALHALALIADSGGPMFRGFVEPTLSTVLKLLLNVQSTSLEVLSCLGRLLSSLVTTIGPELQGNDASIVQKRFSILCATSMLQSHQHPVVQASAITCLQQMHMFAGNTIVFGGSNRAMENNNNIDLAALVPNLCQLLKSSHLVLRKAAVSCLRQLAQREAREVCEIALTIVKSQSIKDTHNLDSLTFIESGLPGILFSVLDHELDPVLLSNVHDTLTFILQATAADNLTMWLNLLREVLTVSTDSLDVGGQKSIADDKDEDEAAVDDSDEFTTGEEIKDNIQPRWPTRVFAAECLRKIIQECCQGNRVHYDLGLAKEMQLTQSRGDYLVLHLSELVRVSFMASTSESDPLRLEGLQTLEVIIEKFGDTAEPEFPGHVILEQYQAQVGAALRPAFAPETPSHVTSAACEVCSAWISSGVARDLSDLRRVYQLLVTSLDKMEPKNSQLYNESALTLEKLSILKAWAEVYVVTMRSEMNAKQMTSDFGGQEIESGRGVDDEFGDFESMNKNSEENLTTLVQAELPSLSKHWLAALKDHALLSLPPEFKSQLPFEGGAFYTNDTVESARPHYRSTWPSILEASAIWFSCSQFGIDARNNEIREGEDEINRDRFFLIFGICMEALSNNRSADMSREEVTSCLKALRSLLSNSFCRKDILIQSSELLIELSNVLHRVVLTRDNSTTQVLVMEVLQLVLKAARERLELIKKQKRRELEVPANQEMGNIPELALLGDGGEDGIIEPGKSIVFATLEVCLCVLIRHYPDLSPRASSLNSVLAMQAKSRLRGRHMTEEQKVLVSMAVVALSGLPNLASPSGALTILPSILWLFIGVLKGTAVENDAAPFTVDTDPQVSATLNGLRSLASSHYASDPRSSQKWAEISQSALLRLLQLVQEASKENNPEEEVTLLLAVSIFVLYGDASVVCSSRVHDQVSTAFSNAFNSSDPKIRLRIMKMMHGIFLHKNKSVSLPYIRSLVPKVAEFLSCHPESREVKQEVDLLLSVEGVATLEALMWSIGDQEEKKLKFLSLLLPILIGQLLAPGEMKEASPNKLKLHENALARITKIGQEYGNGFKTIMVQSPDLKATLEAAALANKERLEKARKGGSNQAQLQQRKIHEYTPSIKLTTDFSKFTTSAK